MPETIAYAYRNNHPSARIYDRQLAEMLDEGHDDYDVSWLQEDNNGDG